MDIAMGLATEDGCALAIGAYPRFRYDGRGGAGTGRASDPLTEGWRTVTFDASRLVIPPLSRHTTRFLGVPLPPGLRIAIDPQHLAGRWHPETGAVDLRFLARFRPLLGTRPMAPDLIVSTELVTRAVAGRRHRAEGRPLDATGRGVLVGIAAVEPTGTAWVDRFLGLPDEALAVLHCRFLTDPPQP